VTTSISTHLSRRRLGTLEGAVALSVFVNVVGNLAIFLPGRDETPGAAIVVGSLLSVAVIVLTRRSETRSQLI
jgi:hypothetical protein